MISIIIAFVFSIFLSLTAPTIAQAPIILSKYSSELTLNSGRYSRHGASGVNYYYEAIQVQINTTGTYIFQSSSSVKDTYGYLYQGNFYPSYPSYNIVTQDDNSAGNGQFQLKATLRSDITYILVFTTSSEGDIGLFSILASGPDIVFTPIEVLQTTTIPTQTTKTTYILPKNMVINGDAETGSCASTNLNVVHPTGWNYNGSATQIRYTGDPTTAQFLTTGTPKDGGACLFYGGESPLSNLSSMWQIINLTNSYDVFINNQILQFNLSAWIGGYGEQHDHASVSLTFLNKAMEELGSSITIGPVLLEEREKQSKILFKSATGFVPKGTYMLRIDVQFILVEGAGISAYVDNIALILYS